MEEGKVAGRDPSLEQLVALRETCGEMQVGPALCVAAEIAGTLKHAPAHVRRMALREVLRQQ